MASDSGFIARDPETAAKRENLGEVARSIGDSKFLGQRSVANRLQVYEVGPRTVVGFGGRDVPSEYCIAESRQFLVDLIREHACQELTFDLAGVRQIPSGMLGVLASMRNLGVVVSICNPSSDVREVLETTQLDTIFQIREMDS